ncbi:outer membrane protein assembly factor BamA [Flavobacterium cyanobacteriorum]|uniref:Outer membrane protein assembly factor BamA n=1 Tax=Flavobacterium cyanobacteriorum TaxID=2022802 RepID=A0A255ZA02_9FLAO|nr:POTRA domain-containing protein [Flavobacterium cyanobacteriorum]OYQ37450.1 outer membrane protein assembly factor BamA [Flavobacterium cyanobacteriorum]
MKQLSVIKIENVDLEKPVNKLNKTLMFYKNIVLFIVIFFTTTSLIAQEAPAGLEPGREYILAGVGVTGKISYNENTVITFTGLEKGQAIHVPGEEISNAIKKLWKLGLFSDIDFYVTQMQGDSIYLELDINELPKLSDVKIQGVRKGKRESLIKDTQLAKGKVVNENLITNTKNYIENKYKKDGYFNTKVAINVIPDSTNTVKMVVNVDRGKKVKVKKIEFNGNTKLSDGKLRGTMKNTKKKSFPNPLRIFKSSKYIAEKYKEDLNSIVNKYKENGYRDARVTSDTVVYNPKNNTVSININIEEGRKYYFGDIKYLGNTVYNNQQLNRILGIKKGDVYNGVMLQKRIADPSKPDGEDLTNLYQNNGYLFSNINAVEVSTANDTIDFEIRVTEGPIAYFNNVTVVGNDKTHDHVIYRELRTRPGMKWNKEEVINTIREIGALGFFDPEAIRPDVKNPDPSTGNVDIEWNLVEKGSSQIELQGGYGGGGFIGTLGLSFNNFSARNLFNKSAYKPLPMGDGQRVSLRLQGSTYFQTYSLSFSEPWLGGKKPVQFTTSLSHSKQFLYNFSNRNVDRSRSFNITSVSLGLAKRLSDPDIFLTLSHALSFQYYDLNNYNTGLFTFGDGSSKNLAYTIGLTRNNKGVNPIYPTSGSEFSVSARVTFPYSLVNGVDYGNLKNLPEYKSRNNGPGYQINDNDGNPDNDWVPSGSYLDENGRAVTDPALAAPDRSKIDQKRFNWLEYYKIKFRADWYTKLYDKLVLRSLGEFGFLGAYNSERGLVPFERFFLGGDGLANFALDGREVIQLRGYPNQSLAPIDSNGDQNGATIYNKFTLELRYPITLKQAASIYALTFAEAGASYDSFRNYNPFALKRSAGFGLRVFMPAFGLLGIDFGHGFDPIPGATQKNGWETHFIIGQQF